MKRLLAVFAIIAVVLSAAPKGQAQYVSVDFFYDNLNQGSWFEVGDYGYCWQPDVAVDDPTWRPYADGYWAYTDDGWTWISYEDFGWATYHYGRWVKLAEYGWVWKPGYEWGPAWVSWRTGGNYIGWAPLPPETEYVYESRPITGHLDVEFDIGPASYNFCDVRYIGEPVLRSRLVPYQQNVTYVTQTVNVTNITYKNKTVYNYGPDINVLNQYSSRPIQRLKLERQANVDVAASARSGGLTKVQGNALVIAAPTRLNKPTKEIAPPKVKMKVAQPKIEKGWSVAGDPNAQTQLKERIKSEDLTKVPPPTMAVPPNAKASLPPGAAGAASGQEAAQFEKGKGKNKNKAAQLQNAEAAGAATSPIMNPAFPERGKKKGKNAEQFQPGSMSSPPAGMATETSPSENPTFPEHGKKKGKNTEQFQPGSMSSPPAGMATETSPSGMPGYGKPGKGAKARRGEQFGGNPPSTGAPISPEGMNPPEGNVKRKEFERQNTVPSPSSAPNTGENVNEFRGKNRKFQQPQQPTMSPAGQPGGNLAPSGGATPQGISDQPGSGMKNRKFERQQPGPPPSSQTGAPGAASDVNVAPQGGPAGGQGRGKLQVESTGTPATGQPAAGNQPSGERKHEGKGKAAQGTPTPGQP